MDEFKINFQCPICLETCKNAIESTCCYTIFCEICSKLLRSCGICRSEHPGFRPSYAVRKIIGNIPIDCEFCSIGSTMSNIEAHKSNCDLALIICKYCTINMTRSEMAQHIIDTHPEDLISKLTLRESTISDGHFLGKKKNLYGRKAKLGKSGKYYCGGQLETQCNCCNGICGPNSGCNCCGCMIIDIQTRKLPIGYLVNSRGSEAKKGRDNKIYCGCRVLVGTPNCDGFCGPTNGPNCKPCAAIQAMWNTRYEPITSRWLSRIQSMK